MLWYACKNYIKMVISILKYKSHAALISMVVVKHLA